jgi:hypothetical protein
MSSKESDQESKILLTDEDISQLNSQEEPYDFDNPEFVFTPKGVHNWRQEGIYVVCRSCEIEHAIYIGPNKMMVGLNDDGSPRLVDRQDYLKKGYKAFK